MVEGLLALVLYEVAVVATSALASDLRSGVRFYGKFGGDRLLVEVSGGPG